MNYFACAATAFGFDMLCSAPAVQAGTFAFPSSSSTEVSDSAGGFPGETGYFHFVGMKVDETFTDPVLTAVGQVDLTYNQLNTLYNPTEFLGMGVSVNGVVPGGFSIEPGDPLGPIDLCFTGLGITGIGAGMDYAVSLFVDPPVSSGAGAVRFGLDAPGSLTLYGVTSDVPVPAALPLLLGGPGVFGLIRKRA